MPKRKSNETLRIKMYKQIKNIKIEYEKMKCES
jgi:hypothetical protein